MRASFSIRTSSSRKSVMDELPNKFQSQDMSVILSGHEDELQKYKHKCRNPQLVRLEKVQDLVYKKKLQNKSKYTMKSKIHTSALPVPQGTVSIMLNSTKKMEFNVQKKIPARSKFKMKWKTIQWLMEQKKEAIHQLFNNYSLMLKFAKNKIGGMNRSEFKELLSYVGLGSDQSLIDKLFYIFDEDGSGTVDYKELIIGLEVFKEDSIEEKMKVFFDLCDLDGSGAISEKEIYEVLKQNMNTSDDRLKLRKTIANIFRECDINGDGQLSKEEVLAAAKQSIILRQLLEQSVRDVKQIDLIIDNDLHQHSWVPATASHVNYKEGIFFPWNDKIIQAFSEFENIYDHNKANRAVLDQDI